MSSISDNKNLPGTPDFSGLSLQDLLKPSKDAPGTSNVGNMLSLLGIAGAEGVSDVRETTQPGTKGVLSQKMAALGAPPVPKLGGRPTAQTAKAYESMNVDISKAFLSMANVPMFASSTQPNPTSAKPKARGTSAAPHAGTAPTLGAAQPNRGAANLKDAAAPAATDPAAVDPATTTTTIPTTDDEIDAATQKVTDGVNAIVDGTKTTSGNALYAFMVLRMMFGQDAIEAMSKISDINSSLQEKSADIQIAKAQEAAQQQAKAAKKAQRFGVLSKVVTAIMVVATVVSAVMTLGAAAPGMAILLGCVLAAGMLGGFVGAGVAAGKKEGSGFDVWKGLDMASTVGDAVLCCIGIGAVMAALGKACAEAAKGATQKAAKEALARASETAAKSAAQTGAKAGADVATQAAKQATAQAEHKSMALMKEMMKQFYQTVKEGTAENMKIILQAGKKNSATSVAKAGASATAGSAAGEAAAGSLEQVTESVINPMLKQVQSNLGKVQLGLALTQGAAQETQAVGNLQVGLLEADASQNQAVAKFWEAMYSQAKTMYGLSQDTMQNFVDSHNQAVDGVMQVFNNRAKTQSMIGSNI